VADGAIFSLSNSSLSKGMLPLSEPFLSQEVPSTSSGSLTMLDVQNRPEGVSLTVSSSSTVVDVQFRPEEVSSTSSGSSTVLDEQNRPEGVSSTASGSSTGSGCTDESLGSSWVSDVSNLAASELGVIPDSGSFFVYDHVPFPVGATDDDSCDSADDDHVPSLVTPATVPGSTGLIDESLHSGFLFGLGERLVKLPELVKEHGGRRGKKGFFFFLGCSKMTTFCLGFLYFIFYYNMGISVTLTLKS
jgi:hypothetical protein